MAVAPRAEKVASVNAEKSSVEKGEAILLGATQAQCHGKLGCENNNDFIGSWIEKGDWLSWQFAAPPGNYDISLTYSCHDGSAGSVYVLAVATERGKTLAAAKQTVAATGQFWGNYRTIALGRVQIVSKGNFTLTIKPESKPGEAVMNLRCVTLTPVGDKK